LSNGSQIKTVDQNQFVATINGGTLPIRFRIEAGAPPPPPPPPPGPWKDGDLITYPQVGWGDLTSEAGSLLNAQYDYVYGSTGGLLEVGIAGAAGFSLLFTSASGVLGYLPAQGALGALNADLVDPTSSASGGFGGEVTALSLNVDFSDAGVTLGGAGIPFGDLTLCNFNDLPRLNGVTVRQFLGAVNTLLGGGSANYGIAELFLVSERLNVSFEGRTPSQFAQDHLVNGACPGGWQEGDLVTYSQDSWGSDPATSAAAALLVARFGLVYPFSAVEVGVSGTAGFSMVFTSASAVLAYLPALGGPAPLNSDLLDPTSTSAGVLGGFVLALRLDVDFSDASYLVGNSGLRFGDLRLCRFTSLPALNGNTVREFLGLANQMLGGATPPSGGPYTIDDLALVTRDLTLAFEGGVVSQFAQDHLVNGDCPGGWQNGDLITYSQDSWGGDPTQSTAAALLLAQFNSRFPGGVEIGLFLGAGFSMVFSSAEAILDYLPASGATGSLNADLVDPTSSASGYFGGWVFALQLDVDFTDSGHISGTSGLVFGNLRLCGLTATPAYNNLTVRQFLAAMNTALGGGSIAYPYDTMGPLTDEVSLAFQGGVPSSFAQAHLVNGACP
jgi:hypothetical protein